MEQLDEDSNDKSVKLSKVCPCLNDVIPDWDFEETDETLALSKGQRLDFCLTILTSMLSKLLQALIQLKQDRNGEVGHENETRGGEGAIVVAIDDCHHMDRHSWLLCHRSVMEVCILSDCSSEFACLKVAHASCYCNVYSKLSFDK